MHLKAYIITPNIISFPIFYIVSSYYWVNVAITFIYIQNIFAASFIRIGTLKIGSFLEIWILFLQMINLHKKPSIGFMVCRTSRGCDEKTLNWWFYLITFRNLKENNNEQMRFIKLFYIAIKTFKNSNIHIKWNDHCQYL